MNERIEHITKQVDAYFDDLSIEFSRQAWMEKFAELIVRECIRYFNEDYNRNFETLWREDLSIGMKQHFGVKE